MLTCSAESSRASFPMWLALREATSSSMSTWLMIQWLGSVERQGAVGQMGGLVVDPTLYMRQWGAAENL